MKQARKRPEPEPNGSIDLRKKRSPCTRMGMRVTGRQSSGALKGLAWRIFPCSGVGASRFGEQQA
eukprot:scaffold6371_cov110-Isochrysis_galbana.AAC.3